MRTLLSKTACIVGLIVVTFLSPSLAQDPEAQQADVAADLKMTDVIAYSAGVGFVSFSGEVNDNSVFRVATAKAELDDLLKSLVVLSKSGTATVNLPNDVAVVEPIRIVKSETVGEIIQSLRGESISITLDVDKTIQGRVMAVELRSMAEGSELVDREVVSLLTDSGIVSVALKNIVTWTADDASVRERMNRELTTIASRLSHDDRDDLIEVEVRLTGEGKREVMIGWLRSMPLWKPSYRFVDDRLQMWSTIENTSRADWQNVSLTLVDGHPIAFRSPLYATRYAGRKLVPLPMPNDRLAPELLESLAIAQDGNRMADEREKFGGFGGGGMGAMAGGGMGGMGGGTFGTGAPLAKADPSSILGDQMLAARADSSQATGADLHLTTANVTIARGRSRSAPSPELKIDSEVVSLFLQSHNATTPLRCLQVTNRMPMRLPAGPLTVYSAGTFVGDAMLPELSPEIPRLVGFGNDANIRVDVIPQPVNSDPFKSLPWHALSVTPGEKFFAEVSMNRRTMTYRVANRVSEPRTLLIEHPKPTSDWTVTAKELKGEETLNAWRYRIELQANETRTIEVLEEQRVEQHHKWSDMPLDELARWKDEQTVDAKVKVIIEQVLEKRERSNKLTEQLSSLRTRRDRLRPETSRIAVLIRDIALTDGDELRTRYVKKLSQLEDEIESLDEEEAKQDAEQQSLLRELQ